MGAVGGKVRANVARHRQLIVHVEDVGLCLLALAHVHCGRGRYVRHQVGALVRRDVRIHIAELALDHAQAVVDEIRRRHGNLVLVAYPILVVHADEGSQHLVGALRRLIRQGKFHHRSILVGHRHAESADIRTGSS